MATKFDRTLSHEAVLRAANSEFKENIQELVMEEKLRLEKYLEETQDQFSSSDAQMKKRFTI